MLREVLEGPLKFTPEGQAYWFEGEVATGRLVTGLVGVPSFVGVPKVSDPFLHREKSGGL